MSIEGARRPPFPYSLIDLRRSLERWNPGWKVNTIRVLGISVGLAHGRLASFPSFGGPCFYECPHSPSLPHCVRPHHPYFDSGKVGEGWGVSRGGYGLWFEFRKREEDVNTTQTRLGGTPEQGNQTLWSLLRPLACSNSSDGISSPPLTTTIPIAFLISPLTHEVLTLTTRS